MRMIFLNSLYQVLKITLFLDLSSKVFTFLYELIYAVKDNGVANTIDQYQNQLIKLSIVYIVFSILLDGLYYWVHLLNRKLISDIQISSLQCMVKKIIDTSYQNYNKYQTQIQNLIDIAQSTGKFLYIITDMVIIIIINWIMLQSSWSSVDSLDILLILLPLPIYVYMSIKISAKSNAMYRENEQNYGHNSMLINDIFKRLMPIKVFDSSNYEIKQFTQPMGKQINYQDAKLYTQTTSKMMQHVVQNYLKIVTNIMFFIGLKNGNIIELSQLQIFKEQVDQLYWIIQELCLLASQIKYNRDNLEETLDILQESTETHLSQFQIGNVQEQFLDLMNEKEEDQIVQEPDSNQNVSMQQQIIKFQNVTINFGENYIVRNLNLQFTSEKSYALKGHSGCGKSTLFNALVRLLQISNGTIRINNQNIQTMPIEQLRQQITYCNQDSFVLQNKNLQQNVIYNNQLILKKYHEVISISQCNFIDSYTPITVLSGGQKQRVSLARALYRPNTKILLLDESTGALDEKLEMQVVKSVIDYCKQQNILLIMISHRQCVYEQVDEIIDFQEIAQGK